MPEVSLQEVGKNFAEVAAVKSVSFDVESKELVLLGPSGCGCGTRQGSEVFFTGS